MGKIIILIVVLTLSHSLQADSKWQLIRQEDDIQVFTRYTPDSRVKSAKGVVIISARLDNLLKVLEDVQKFPRWLYNCKSAKTIKQVNIVERIDYILTDIPWPSWDRDALVRSVFQQNKSTKVVTITFDSKPNLIPVKPGIVRIKKMTGRMLIIPQAENSVKVIYEVNADPGGRIPTWMVNDMASDFPFFSLKKLRDLAEMNQAEQDGK